MHGGNAVKVLLYNYEVRPLGEEGSGVCITNLLLHVHIN